MNPFPLPLVAGPFPPARKLGFSRHRFAPPFSFLQFLQAVYPCVFICFFSFFKATPFFPPARSSLTFSFSRDSEGNTPFYSSPPPRPQTFYPLRAAFPLKALSSRGFGDPRSPAAELQKILALRRSFLFHVFPSVPIDSCNGRLEGPPLHNISFFPRTSR